MHACVHSLAHMHGWPWLHTYSPMYAQTLNMVLHWTEIFSLRASTQTSLRLSHNEPPAPWSWETSQKVNVFRTFLVFSLLPSPPSLFLYLLMPEPISTSFCLRGCRQPKSVDVRLKISLQGIMRRRCCYDYYALLPAPVHEMTPER